ncbi:MAG: polysaccharide lyase family 8 super-sandwich domain-containing protein, partial [Eubacteriales bacterium]
MKKALLLLVCLLLATAVLGACGKKGPTDSTTTTPPATTTTPPATTTTTTVDIMYLITYHLDGGTNNAGNPAQFRPLEGSVTLGAPTKDHYVFQGWYDNIMLAGTQLTALTTAVQQDLQLYAKWEPVSYQIKYTLYSGGQLPEDAPRSYTVESGAITLPAPTRDGYDFGGWYPTNKFTAGTELTVIPAGSTGEFPVYAKWLPRTYAVTYVLGGGENALTNPTSYETGGPAITLADPSKEGHTFLGWYTTERYAAGTSVSRLVTSGAKEVTLYARWMQNVDVLIEFPMVTTQPVTLPEDQPELDLSEDALLVFDASGHSKPFTLTTPSGERLPLMRGGGVDSEKHMYLNDLPSDWTGHSYLTFPVYSANATGAKIGIILYTTAYDAGNKTAYYRTSFTVTWTGWQIFRVPLEDFTTSNALSSFSTLTYARMAGYGWDFTMPVNTYLAVGDVYLTNEAPKYPVNPDTLDSPHFTEVKERWNRILVGDAEMNATQSSAKARAQSAGSSAASLLASINTTPGTTKIFNDINFANIEQVDGAYDRLHTMARGWATPGSSMYHDEELLNAIKFALQWLYSYDPDPEDDYTGIYGENVRYSRPGNWWNWEIGIPVPLTEILLMLEEELELSFIQQILEPVDYLVPRPNRNGASGRASTARSSLLSALLQEDAERTVDGINALLVVFDYAEFGDGFYTDGSFVEHIATPYVGGYGLSYVNMVTQLLYSFDQTAFDFDNFISRQIDKLLVQFFDSFEPFIYKGTMMAAMTGRNYVSREQTELIGNLFELAASASPELRARFFSVAKYYQENNPEFANLRAHMSYVGLATYEAYLQDSSVQARTGYINAHIFGAMDRVVQHAENYTVVLSLSSTRIYRYEAINDANSSGWYLGDGAVYVYGSHKDAYSNSAFSSIDRMKIPGTTVTTAPRTGQQFTVYSNPYNGNPFAGGVSDGIHAVAVMKVKYVPGTLFTNFSSDLLAHKSWFMFDDELVCLGSNITTTDFDEVLTVIDNRRISVGDVVKINGETYTLTTSAAVREDVSYITLENFGGYYFPDRPTLTLMDKAAGSHYLHLWVSHGQRPKAADYLYVMLPEKSEAEVAAYAADPDIEVLRNDMMISAVRETTLGKTGYAFWYAYTESFFDGLKTNRPCTVLKTENENGSLTFHVSDPSHRLSEVVLTLDGVYDVVS